MSDLKIFLEFVLCIFLVILSTAAILGFAFGRLLDLVQETVEEWEG